MSEYIKLERRFVRGFAVNAADETRALFVERDTLRELAQSLSRLNINEKIKAFGVERVFRVLAATVKENPARYDGAALYIARQVPPLKAGRRWEDWFLSNMHPIYVQENLMRIARLRAE